MPYFWTHTNTELKLNKAFTHGGTSYPKQWLQRSNETQRKEIGLEWRDTPVYKDEKYYRNYLLMDGTVKSDPKPLDGLKTQAVAATKQSAGTRLASSDWMVVRAAEGGAAVPEDWAAYRTAVREYSNSYEVAIEEATFESIQNMRAEWPESPAEKKQREEREAEIKAAEEERAAREDAS